MVRYRCKMAKDQQSNIGMLLFFLALLLGGLVMFSAYRADWFGAFKARRPSYDKALVDMVSVSGGFTVEDLHLSGPEIRKINFAALSHRETFPQIHLTLDPVTKQKPEAVKRMTPLQYSLTFKTKGETEVHFWKRTVVRRDFVPNMVNSVKRAADEFLHIRDMPDRTRPLMRLYI